MAGSFDRPTRAQETTDSAPTAPIRRGPEPPVLHRTEAADSRVDQDRPTVEPDRYIVHPEDTAKLQRAVESSGRDAVGDWLGQVNPRYESGGEAFRNNCGECVRAFATTAQTERAVAAAGDRRLGEVGEMWEWAGTKPVNSLVEREPEKLESFQAQAWEQVAKQLADQPVGTVAVVGVDWAPIDIGGVEVAQGGHWFNAHVTESGLKWVDGQDGTYQFWPPAYASRVKAIESIYRVPGESEWRP